MIRKYVKHMIQRSTRVWLITIVVVLLMVSLMVLIAIPSTSIYAGIVIAALAAVLFGCVLVKVIYEIIDRWVD